MGYAIEDVSVTPTNRGAKSRYPFGELENGQSFVVPAKELIANEGEVVDAPIKRLRSLAASQTAKYATEVLDESGDAPRVVRTVTRRFIVEKPDKKGNVRVGRLDDSK